jgi:hypothetical protein
LGCITEAFRKNGSRLYATTTTTILFVPGIIITININIKIELL